MALSRKCPLAKGCAAARAKRGGTCFCKWVDARERVHLRTPVSCARRISLAPIGSLDIIALPKSKRGCSSVVEHLLAKEDVASSSLVTRSSLRSSRAKAGASAPKPWRRRAAPQATAGRPDSPMYYVYLLQSQSRSDQQYVGSTRDLRRRLTDHNEGRSIHTAKFRPWILLTYTAFAKEKTAIAFERYLKSGSGRAFSKRHFV